MAKNNSIPLMEEVVVTGKHGGRRSDPRYYVPEIPEDRIGIDTKNIASQIKTSLWDVFTKSITEYLSGNEYSGDTLKNIIRQQSLKVPIDLPGDYAVDFDINRWSSDPGRGRAGMDFKDDYRVTFKKEF